MAQVQRYLPHLPPWRLLRLEPLRQRWYVECALLYLEEDQKFRIRRETDDDEDEDEPEPDEVDDRDEEPE